MSLGPDSELKLQLQLDSVRFRRAGAANKHRTSSLKQTKLTPKTQRFKQPHAEGDTANLRTRANVRRARATANHTVNTNKYSSARLSEGGREEGGSNQTYLQEKEIILPRASSKPRSFPPAARLVGLKARAPVLMFLLNFNTPTGAQEEDWRGKKRKKRGFGCFCFDVPSP